MFKVKTEDQFQQHKIDRLQALCLVTYKLPIVQFLVAYLLSGAVVSLWQCQLRQE